MEIKNDIFDVHESNGKGLGAFAANKVMEGTEIVTEKPSVIGPKQTSSFVCVDCFDYIDEQTGKLLISRNFYSFCSTKKLHTAPAIIDGPPVKSSAWSGPEFFGFGFNICEGFGFNPYPVWLVVP